jgi:hypothetical protein
MTKWGGKSVLRPTFRRRAIVGQAILNQTGVVDVADNGYWLPRPPHFI